MKLRKGFVLRDVCGDKALVGEGLEAVDFEHLLYFNETAAWLWEKAEELGTFTTDELIAALCEEYNVDNELATQDVNAIVKKWQEMGLTEA